MIRNLIFLIIAVPVIFSCDKSSERVFFADDLVAIADFIIENKETYSKFYDIMITGDLKDPLNAYNPFGNGFTLFLPTDEAFDRYIKNSEKYNSFNDLLNDVDFVRELGRYHLVQIELRSNEFPYGALPDTTSSGDLLTIGFSSSLDTTIYKVNNVAPIIEINLEMLNGYIHVISEVLEPVSFTGLQWLQQQDEYSILSGALEITGLNDTLGLYRKTGNNQLVKNEYTIFAEHDSIYHRNGINSLDDLIEKYHTPGTLYTEPENGLYQFAAYHILEGSHFLVDFDGSSNYNTLANYPVSIQSGLEVQINTGVDTFRLVYSDTDTTAITHISIYYQQSNVLTKNGAIHFLTDVMELYTLIPRSERTFQFLEEPIINSDSKQANTYEYVDVNEFEFITWSGPEAITYTKSSSSSERAWSNDYLEIEGNFVIEYTMPKILPGKYQLQVATNALSLLNATIVVSLDGKRMGGNFDLTKGGTGNNPYFSFKIGIVEFVKYSGHTIKVESLLPGRMIWDGVLFVPE